MFRIFLRKFYFVFVVPVLVSCASGDDKRAGASQTAALSVPIEGFIIKPSSVSSRIEASGSLVASEETQLHPEINGRVVMLHIPEGEEVSKGTLLVKLYDEDLQSQLKRIVAQKELAGQTLRRLSDLVKVNGISQQEVDQAALQVKTLEAEEEIIRVQIGRTEIRAPFSGILGLRSISEGAYITPSTIICSIRSTAALKLDFSVPEKFGSLIKQGKKVEFHIEGDTSAFSAVVIATEQSIENDTRNMKVRARVQERSDRLIPGGFTEVHIPLGERHDALMVPTQCVIPQARNKVVIISRGGKAAFVPVKTGVRESAMVEITDGLSVGDTLAVTGILFLRPDLPISFSKINQ